MPYTNIHWIKLEKRLLNDHRFYTLSESAQLIYLKMLMLAAETGNKMPKNPIILKSCFRSNLTSQDIENCIKEIIKNFPKFIHSNEFYKFKEWSTRTNWIASKGTPKELPENSKGTVEKNRIDKIIKEYIRVKNWDSLLTENPPLLTDVYKRNGGAAKKLALIELNDDVILKAMNKMNEEYKKNNLNWTLETVIRHFPDLIKKSQGFKQP